MQIKICIKYIYLFFQCITRHLHWDQLLFLSLFKAKSIIKSCETYFPPDVRFSKCFWAIASILKATCIFREMRGLQSAHRRCPEIRLKKIVLHVKKGLHHSSMIHYSLYSYSTVCLMSMKSPVHILGREVTKYWDVRQTNTLLDLALGFTSGKRNID